ncbi:MAG: DUF494 domain-containing protein [Pseudomonadota bacterium]
MKENVLDILMYLFENYMDEDEADAPDQESIEAELHAAGFPQSDINKALNWIEGLAEMQSAPMRLGQNTGFALRHYSSMENCKLGLECQGFLIFLEQTGVIDQHLRETIIDRVMALDTDEIDLEQLKWIILMVLFNQPGREEAYVWMEELIFDESRGYLH